MAQVVPQNCVVVPLDTQVPLLEPRLNDFADSQFVDLGREYSYTECFALLRRVCAGTACCCGINLVLIAIRAIVRSKELDEMRSKKEVDRNDALLDVFLAFLILLLTLCVLCGCCSYCCGHCCYSLCQRPAGEPLPLARGEVRSLLGRQNCLYTSVLIILAVAFLEAYLSGALGVILFVGAGMTSAFTLLPAWWWINRLAREPIKLGLVVVMFWTGALFAVPMAALTNTGLLLEFMVMDPSCSSTLPLGDNFPFEPAGFHCFAKAWSEWIISPGIVEEGFKFVCLLRLCTTLQNAAESNCLRRCPRSSEPWWCVSCGWFLKLAPSPATVVLCGMAIAGGFSTIENLQYNFEAGKVEVAFVRLLSASLHVCMTGTCAFFFAYALFLLPKRRWYVKYVGFLIMALLHGSFDASLVFVGTLPENLCFTRINVTQTDQGRLAACQIYESESSLPSSGASSSGDLQSFDLQRALRQKSYRRLPGVLQDDPDDPVEGLRPFVPLGNCSNVTDDDLDFVCGPPLLSWFPEWPAFAFAGAIVLVFIFIFCCGVPRVEREFIKRREASIDIVS